MPNRRSGVNHENVAASSHPFPSLAPTVSVWASSLSLIFAYLVAGLATLVAGSVIAALQAAAVAVPAMVLYRYLVCANGLVGVSRSLFVWGLLFRHH